MGAVEVQENAIAISWISNGYIQAIKNHDRGCRRVGPASLAAAFVWMIQAFASSIEGDGGKQEGDQGDKRADEKEGVIEVL